MSAAPFTRQLEMLLRRLARRYATPGGTHVQLAVLTGQNSVGVTFAREEVDTDYGVLVTPSWDTTAYVASRSVQAILIGFGTVAPASATVDVVVFRSED